jgi:uncharacterized integral membrane protein
MSWLLLFIIAFFIALVLVLTFMQPAFRVEVGAQVLAFKTRAFPVYLYVLAAFVAGLGLGAAALLFQFISAKTDSIRKNRRIRELEQRLAETERTAAVKTDIACLANGAGDAPEAGKKPEIGLGEEGDIP